MNDPFFELVQDALFGQHHPGGGVALNGRVSKGPTKLAVRALQKTVRKVLHTSFLTNEFVCPTV